MGREVMIVLFFVVCVASLLFFAVFLFQCSRPRRSLRKAPVVRKVSTTEAVEFTAGRRWLIHLEQQMAEFLLQNKTAAILLVVLAISSGSLVAQEQGGQPPNSDEQQPQPMVQPLSDGVNAPATQSADQQQTVGQSASPPAPSPLPTPAMTGPLQAAPPITFEGGPFGKLNLNGVVSGLEQFKNYCSRASTGRAALQRRVPADPSPPSRLQPAAPRLHK